MIDEAATEEKSWIGFVLHAGRVDITDQSPLCGYGIVRASHKHWLPYSTQIIKGGTNDDGSRKCGNDMKILPDSQKKIHSSRIAVVDHKIAFLVPQRAVFESLAYLTLLSPAS
ncbi:uncharacterized protein PHALS_14213 [Plasmopara halstedii]|uniref:Uncharacterized protein n=1 Tax=Plasmopara halstedii TaxID=4781 RepID=A0A0P1AR20_PLAHL|nr:uncharacterized protein PHALS_14213 [Plasmopara halstedii]CEG43934.1 hypothetical protein PHALS_14213 [Plasmopara halstedii]|eukprot:XP_024580303.1 hypothetical protein PHALS_14213 [Plasmopara halstedii]